MRALMQVARAICAWRGLVVGCICVIVPMPLLFVSFGPSPLVPRAAFVLLFMSLSWALTPWSIYVTSLFPLTLLPLLGLAGASATAALYWNDAIVLFLGSFLITSAMEKWLLHKRIATRIVMLFKRPQMILLAVMSTTAFLSLFMSNTATAALMVPLILPLIGQLRESPADIELTDVSIDNEDAALAPSPSPSVEAAGIATGKRDAADRFSKSLLLGVAYSASLGGIGTLIGTGPNLTLVQLLRVLYPSYPGLSFGAWMGFAMVLSISLIGILWAFFVLVYNRKRLHLVNFELSFYRNEYEKLGSISFEEIMVLACLGVMSILWLTRSGIPPSIPGWTVLFKDYVQDGTVCIAISTCLFLIPSRKEPGKKILSVECLKDLHWDVILLLGAGFAIGHAFVSSGLTLWIGSYMTTLRVVPLPVIVFIVSTLASFWTEVCSNVATANILLPIVASLGVSLNQNPLVLMIPTTLSVSLAFMLPVATPPNALVMSAGVLQPRDMMFIGFFLNWVGVVAVSSWTLVAGGLFFGIEFGQVPSWANHSLS